MSIDPTPEIRLNLRMAMFCLAVIMGATIVGTGYNTYRSTLSTYDRKSLWDTVQQIKETEASNTKKLNGRIDYLRRSVNKRFAEIETSAKK